VPCMIVWAAIIFGIYLLFKKMKRG